MNPSVRLTLATRLQQTRRGIALGLAGLGGVFLLLLLVLVCANSGARVLGLPLRGAVESSGLLGGLACALALGFAQINRNHITGGVAIHLLPRRVRLGLDALTYAVGAVFFALAAWELWDMALFTFETGETIDGVGGLYPWFIMLAVPGFLGQAVIMLLYFCTTLLIGEE